MAASKAYRIAQAGNALIVHVKRFTDKHRKLRTHMGFDEQVNLQVFERGGTSGGVYELVGAVVHEGVRVHAGHYVAYVRNGKQWHVVASA